MQYTIDFLLKQLQIINNIVKTIQLINRLFQYLIKKNLKFLFQNFFSAINDDSEISWNEFLMFQLQAKSILQDRWPIYNIGQVREAFAEMDSNGNGKITRQEFITEVANSFDKRYVTCAKKIHILAKNVSKCL